MDYLGENEALQIWIKAASGLNSYRLKDAKPQLARPVILFETPSRGKSTNLGRYKYTIPVKQYGKLFVNSVEQAHEVQENLIKDLEDRVGVLPLYGADKLPIAGVHLKAVVIDFEKGEQLDIPFTISYEATYSRTKPAEAPHAVTVTNTITTP